MSKEQVREAVDRATKKFVDEGMIVEAGWVGYQMLVVPAGASKTQVTETKKAFFAGAHHLFASIMSILGPGGEVTDKDLDRMTAVSEELEKFAKELVENGR